MRTPTTLRGISCNGDTVGARDLVSILAPNQPSARRNRYVHLEAAACDSFDARMHRPGTLFELQLPPLHVDLSGRALLLGKLGEQFPRLVLGGDERQRTQHEEQG